MIRLGAAPYVWDSLKGLGLAGALGVREDLTQAGEAVLRLDGAHGA